MSQCYSPSEIVHAFADEMWGRCTSEEALDEVGRLRELADSLRIYDQEIS